MTEQQKDIIIRKLEALTEGPSPLLHSVHLSGEMPSVHIQPWGNPIYLSWEQAQVFTQALPIEFVPRKKARPEHRSVRFAEGGYSRKYKRA